MDVAPPELVPEERLLASIQVVRGQRVMLDRDLAALYGVETRSLNRAVRRNLDRFPGDFMFQLTADEVEDLRSQIGISSGHGGRRYLPFVFTEQGVAMLSSVLSSPRAIQVNIEIMRAFVRLRAMAASHAALARKLDELENRYDRQFASVFDAIRKLMTPPPVAAPRRKRRIGFETTGDTPA
ncbi:MAG: ORF6N domain-containing protein [Dehalococcoidia bacterium]|nr:ORF6N domain-containing protein [Dehalococcoidia bacterium]